MPRRKLYTGSVIEALQRVFADQPRIAYALVFGSVARQQTHAHSDVDVAIGAADGERFSAYDVGDLTSRLESACGRPVQIVLLDEAPPGLAYRVFKEGQPILMRDERAFRARLARAILEYLDYQPVEALFTRAVLRAADGR